jgi:TNF receptor-associated factor 2
LATNVNCEKCREAIQQLQQLPADATAPQMNQIYRSDVATKRSLATLQTKCPNDPCPFTGPFSDYEKHFLVCEYQEIECPNNCKTKIKRNKLEEHKTKCEKKAVTCDYCSREIPRDLWTAHQRTCDHTPERCAHCNQRIKRLLMAKHLAEECVRRNTCPFGCTEVSEGSFEEHNRNNYERHSMVLQRHLNVLEGRDLNALLTSMSRLSKTDVEAVFKDVLAVLQRQDPNAPINQPVRNLEQELTALTVPLANPEQDSVLSYTEAARLLGSDVDYQTLKTSNEELESKCAALKTGIERSYKKLLENEATLQASETRNREMERRLQKMEDVMRNKNKDIAVIQRRLNHLECTTWDGIFIWRITNVASKRAEAQRSGQDVRSTSLYSPTFFTSQAGYRLRLRVFLNGEPGGDAANRFLSLFICVCRGQYDAILPWPFRRNVNLMLLDQSAARQHVKKSIRQDGAVGVYTSAFKRPESEMNVPIGFTQFVELEKIFGPEGGRAAPQSSPLFLEKDSIFIKCVVEPVDY